MNAEHFEDFEEQPTADRDPLDDLLAEAHWPEPTPLVEERLQRHWRTLRPRESRFDRRWLVAAAAAVLIGVVWCARSHWNAANRVRVPIAVPDPLSQPTPPPPPKIVGTPQELPPQYSTSRPANPIEIAVLDRDKKKTKKTKKIRKKRPIDPLVVAAKQMERYPGAVIAEKPETTIKDHRAFESRLLALIPRSNPQHQRTLLRLLNSVASPRSTPLLLACRTRPDLQPIVEPTLLRVADANTLYRLSQTEFVATRQAKFLEPLLTHDDPQAPELFLQAVMSPQTRHVAFELAAITPNPPTEAFFEALNHRRADVRTIAALVLGRVLDDTVTPRLVQWIHREPSRHELWIALLDRPEPQVRTFIAQACRSRQVFATVSSAELMRQAFDRPAIKSPVISNRRYLPISPS